MNNHMSKIKLVTYIGNAISIFSGILTIISFYGFKKSEHITYILIAVLLSILTIGIFLYRHKISKHILTILLNKTVPNSNVKIIDKKVIYTHEERYKFSFESSYYVKVIGDVPIDRFEEQMKWTAGFVENIKPLNGNEEIEYDTTPLSHIDIEKQRFNIKFPLWLNKDDEPYKTGFKIEELNDEKHISKPILQSGVYHITNKLILIVYFNETLNPILIRGLKYAHLIDKSPYDTEKLEIKYDENKCMNYVEFKVKNPIYGGKYAIEWSFNN